MNRSQKVSCYASLAGLFLLGLGVTTSADVARVDEIDALEMHAMAFNAANTTFSLEGARLRAGITESGCLGAYSPAPDTVVFHSVCRGLNAVDNETALADLAQNRSFMFSSAPPRYAALDSNRLPQSSFHAHGARELELGGARWGFEVLDRIAKSQADIAPATAVLPSARSTDEGDADAHHDSGDDGDKGHDGEKGKDDDPDPAVVPEPATLLLLATGGCVLGLLRRRLTAA